MKRFNRVQLETFLTALDRRAPKKSSLPEKHDWALSKISRLEDKDMVHLKAAHKTGKFDVKILESRLLSEMSHVQPRDRLEIHFLAVIEELFGAREAARVQQVLQRRHQGR